MNYGIGCTAVLKAEGVGKPIIAVDMDGVLTDEPEWDHDTSKSPNPRPENIAKVNALYDSGKFILVVYTARPEFTRDETTKWLKKNKVQHHRLITDKLVYDILIDDRAMPDFPGTSPSDIKLVQFLRRKAEDGDQTYVITPEGIEKARVWIKPYTTGRGKHVKGHYRDVHPAVAEKPGAYQPKGVSPGELPSAERHVIGAARSGKAQKGYAYEDLKWVDHDGKSLSKQAVAKLKEYATETIPTLSNPPGKRPIPAYLDRCFINTNPKAKILACWFDKNGKKQSIYARAFSKTNSAKSFAAAARSSKKMKDALPTMIKDAQGGNDAALAATIVALSGIRPGTAEKLGERLAYGATTLQARHISSINGDVVKFEFAGKHQGENDPEIRNKAVAITLQKRIGRGGGGKRRLFNTNEKAVNRYLKERFGADVTCRVLRKVKATGAFIRERDRRLKELGRKPTRAEAAEIGIEAAKVAQRSLFHASHKTTLDHYIDPHAVLTLNVKAEDLTKKRKKE